MPPITPEQLKNAAAELQEAVLALEPILSAKDDNAKSDDSIIESEDTK